MTMARLHTPGSGVFLNVVLIDVPDTPRMNPGYLVILSLRRISLLGGSTLITFFVDTHSARYQRDSFTAPQKTRLVQGCVRLLTDDNGPFAHTRQRRFFERGSNDVPDTLRVHPLLLSS